MSERDTESRAGSAAEIAIDRWKTRDEQEPLDEGRCPALIIESDLPEPVPGPRSTGFLQRAEIRVPALADLPARTAGRATHLVIDLWADLPDDEHVPHRVSLRLNGVHLEQRILVRWYRRHQYFIPLHRLIGDLNRLELAAESVDDQPRRTVPHTLDVFLSNRESVLDTLERDSIWIFSSARSGSTWLGQDILGWRNRSRPMDETGLGRMAAPLELQPERFIGIADRSFHFEGGFNYESGMVQRGHDGLPPFERHLAEIARTEPMEHLFSRYNRVMLLSSIRELALTHVINTWGVLDYDRVVFKAPTDSIGADLLMQALPNAQMIHLLRDGRDVMRSWFSPFMSPTLSATTDARTRREAIGFYAHFWNFITDIIRSAYEAHNPTRRLLLRYEDLRLKSSDGIRKLFDHL